jgi:hypothetical protein
MALGREGSESREDLEEGNTVSWPGGSGGANSIIYTAFKIYTCKNIRFQRPYKQSLADSTQDLPLLTDTE